MPVIRSLLERADARLGEAVETAVAAHHRRRLSRLGHHEALHPPTDGLWASGDLPTREGNSVDVLLDGATALPAIEDALRSARSRVQLAGWHFTPGFVLNREGGQQRQLRELLAELAERIEVQVLMWAGAPLPVFNPRRSDARAVRDELTNGTRVRCALDSHERPLHCHHEKLVIVDDETAFVGGIDLTSLAGDRFDTRDHPARGKLGWHDAATRLRGPAVADVAGHFAARWREVTAEPLEAPPAPPSAGSHEVQVLRTIPERIYEFAARGRFSIVEAYLRALRKAEHFIYLENQFLWSPEITGLLAAKLREPPRPGFRIVVVLPENANNGQEDTRGQLGVLADADAGAGRLLGCTVRSKSGNRSERLYVHAKIGIVDDRWLTIGSANLNAHSFFNDTEMNIAMCDPELARDTRLRLWAEHLERPVDAVSGDPTSVIDEIWRPTARDQRQRADRGDPLTHRLVEMPAVSRRAARLRGPLDSLIVDG